MGSPNTPGSRRSIPPARAGSAGFSQRLLSARALWLGLWAVLGCQEAARPVGAVGGGAGTLGPDAQPAVSLPSAFLEIRELLREDPVGALRAHVLGPKVSGICADAAQRATFLADAQATVAAEGPESRRLAEDVVEHVATACFRGASEVALELVAQAAERVPSPARWDVLRARFLAADGRSTEARPFAEAAMKGGSVHARALLANILAEEARAAGPGYREGMYEPALAVVAAEPDGNWPLIDLTAVLSTRARLLSERAVYEPAEARRETLLAVRAVHERLGLSPFPAQVRSLTLDAACFDAVELGESPFAACARAAEEHGHLGAAFLAGRGEDPKRFDLARLEALRKARLELQGLNRTHWVLVAFRGDETELVAWLRPAAELLRSLAVQKVKLVVYVRGSSPRMGALVERAFELAEARPELVLSFPNGAEAMPCLVSMTRNEAPPGACPLSEAQRRALAALGRPGLALLVGRDLDAELEDLRAAEIPEILASLRQPALERSVAAHLKSLSDVFLLSHRAKTLGGSMRSRPDAP